MKRALVSMLMATTFTGATLSGSPAFALETREGYLPQDQIAAIRTKFDRFNVDKKTQDDLLHKFLTGQRWDSEAGIEPVSTETSDTTEGEVTLSRYPDGSLTYVTRRSLDGNSRKISGCQVSQNQDRVRSQNCFIEWDAVTWSMTFRSTYNWYQFGSEIESVGSVTGGGAGDISAHKAEITHRHGRGHTADAIAQASMLQKIGGIGGRRVGINLKVSSALKARESSFG